MGDNDTQLASFIFSICTSNMINNVILDCYFYHPSYTFHTYYEMIIAMNSFGWSISNTADIVFRIQCKVWKLRTLHNHLLFRTRSNTIWPLIPTMKASLRFKIFITHKWVFTTGIFNLIWRLSCCNKSVLTRSITYFIINSY